MSKKMRKSRAKHFSEEQIQKLRNDPNVRYADDHTIRFKYEFRVKLYEAWEKEKRQGIKRVLKENGYDLKELGDDLIATMNSTFRKHGSPSNIRTDHPVGSCCYKVSAEDNEYLLSTGRFKKSRNGRGITFSENFIKEIAASYPEISVEDAVRKAGIEPERIGYQRIYILKRQLSNGKSKNFRAEYTPEFIEKYKNHPYIQSVTSGQLRFSKPFCNEASFLIEIMNVIEILKLYEIDPDDLPASVIINLKYRLTHWKKTDDQCKDITSQLVRIQQRRCQKLTEILEERFRKIREEIPQMSYEEKKILCFWVQGYPIDRTEGTSISWLLKKISFSRSSYYNILRNNHYGIQEYIRNRQDDKDIEVIRSVMDYRGYRKGIRQIYMIMNDVAGYHFSMNKIKRLMKKYDLHSGLREKKQSRIEMRRQLEERKKDNLLKRRFRIARPNTNILTDVTYIPYGNDQLAYGSACIDSVTGRLYDLTVSDSNNMDLVSSTVEKLKEIQFAPDAIFHSDQGALYLTETFQNMIKELGLRQSMSKRGNCWDNSPQESFFGRFKDEVDYRNCKNLIELQVKSADYKDYFNNERRQWDRNRMTPAEYERYLKEMDEETFQKYLQKEEEKYAQMKQKAAQQAKKRAVTLGV